MEMSPFVCVCGGGGGCALHDLLVWTTVQWYGHLDFLGCAMSFSVGKERTTLEVQSVVKGYISKRIRALLTNRTTTRVQMLMDKKAKMTMGSNYTEFEQLTTGNG